MSIESNIFRMYRLTDSEQAEFWKEYAEVRREVRTAVLLALFGGFAGAHHFYMRRYLIFALSLLFLWTFIPLLEGWVEAIFLPNLVREHNEEHAVRIANSLTLLRQLPAGPMAGAPVPGVQPAMVERVVVREIVKIPCKYCGSLVEQTASSCPNCGGNLH